MQYNSAEDDSDLPGLGRLGLSTPGDNRKYVMYHGTTRRNAELILVNGFRQSADGMLGRGVSLSRDLQKASRYPIGHPESDKVVIKVKVNVGKVIAINRQNHPYQKTWHDYGYDTAWMPPNCGMVKSGLEEDCVWDPNRIKILKTINPRAGGAWAYSDTDTNMQYDTAEDDSDLPGLGRLGLSTPGDNRKYVMYHGTTRRNAELILVNGFRQSADGMLGRGVSLSRDLQKASRYPIGHPESDKVVIKVKVNVGKVIAINRQNHPYQKTWHDYGYDTAWMPPNCGMVKSGLEEDCVWDPNRIKILKTINPRAGGAWAYSDTDTNMQYDTAEDDSDLPGLGRLGLSTPGDNRKYVMYHGTTRRNAELILVNGFRQSADGMLGRGVSLSRDLQKASRYPIGHPESDKVVIKVKVNVGKVIAINRQNHPYQKTWHDYGYDTAWMPPNCGMVKSGLEEDCVWDPNRIKILKTINPRAGGAWAYSDTDTNMQYNTAEDDSDLPGLGRLGLSTPGDNRKYVMYHGTTRRNAELILVNGFRQSADGMLGRGVSLSRDLQKASRYPIGHPESDKVVIKVKVNVGKVIAINRQNHPYQKTWHDYGYDTAWMPPNCGMVKSGLEEDCVWDPNRIKILKTINPRAGGAWAYSDTGTDMQYEWAEDDFVLPYGVVPLGLSAPGDNRKYVMYHGTTKKNADLILANGFRQSADGMLGRGVYLSRDLQKASRYPIGHPVSDKVVIKVRVNVGKVIAIDRQYHPKQKTWHDYGYDTAWVPPNNKMVSSGLEEDCVWDPERIKILNTINPRPVKPSSGHGARGYK